MKKGLRPMVEKSTAPTIVRHRDLMKKGLRPEIERSLERSAMFGTET